jgi:serine/threonine protein kinase
MASSCFSDSQPLYEEIAVVGTGAYGTVYKGCDLKTSRIVAMKRIRIQLTEEVNALRYSKRISSVVLKFYCLLELTLRYATRDMRV